MLCRKKMILIFLCLLFVLPTTAQAKSTQEDIVYVLRNGPNALGAVGLCDVERAKLGDINQLENWFAKNFDDHKYIWLTFISSYISENKTARRLLAYHLQLQLSGNNSCPVVFDPAECPALIERYDKVMSILKE